MRRTGKLELRPDERRRAQMANPRLKPVGRAAERRRSQMKQIATIAACLALGTASLCAADVKENWEKHCGSCHGKDGKGQTKAGKLASVKDFTDPKYQESFTDEQAYRQIKEGMKDKAGKEKMKPFGDKLTEEEIKALVAFIRELKK
jgi:cytochrome c553